MKDRGGRKEVIEIRVTATEKAAFVSAAGLSSMSLSSWARSQLTKAARRDHEEAGKETPLRRDLRE